MYIPPRRASHSLGTPTAPPRNTVPHVSPKSAAQGGPIWTSHPIFVAASHSLLFAIPLLSIVQIPCTCARPDGGKLTLSRINM